MNEENPAVQQRMAVPPAMLEEVERDPKVLTNLARKMLLIQMDAIHNKLRDPAIPMGQRLSWADSLAKIGDVYPKASVQGTGSGSNFSVNILLSGQPSSRSAGASVAEVTVIEAIDAAVTDVTPSGPLTATSTTREIANASV